MTWKEPEMGWVDYFINSFYSQSLINTVLNIIDIDDLDPMNFDTNWVDYNYSDNMKED